VVCSGLRAGPREEIDLWKSALSIISGLAEHMRQPEWKQVRRAQAGARAAPRASSQLHILTAHAVDGAVPAGRDDSVDCKRTWAYCISLALRVPGRTLRRSLSRLTVDSVLT
jgi:hypothetical protein